MTATRPGARAHPAGEVAERQNTSEATALGVALPKATEGEALRTSYALLCPQLQLQPQRRDVLLQRRDLHVGP